MNVKRIELMRPDPHVFHGETHVKITGVQIELFRIIVLNKGVPVRNDSISQLRTTQATSVKSQIRYLRDQLEVIGCADLICLERGIGYSACLTGWEVDCLAFEELVQPLNTSLDALLRNPIPREEAAREIETLKHALAQWLANPAEGLDEEYYRFDALKERAVNRLLMARLYSGDYEEIREAIVGLKARARREPDIAVWKLLLLATDAINGSITSISDDIARQYARNPPNDLQQLIIAIQKRALKHNPFLIESRGSMVDATSQRAESEDHSGLLHLCSLIGISTASKLSLANSHISPLECIRRTRSRLDFSGVLASKWVQKQGVLREFKQLLSRLGQENGEVRFLIINPFGEAFRRLHELRDGMISTNSLDTLRALSAEHSSFSVRLFDTLPAFRIVSIDDDVLSFSPYRLGASAYVASGMGWESPHIVLDPLADYPLAEAFRLLFSETWEKAMPLEQAFKQ